MKSCIVCGVETAEAAVCPSCGADLKSSSTRTKKRVAPAKEQDPPGAAGLLQEAGLWTKSKIGRRQISTKTGERHFLVPPFGEALRLESGPPLVLGRDKECDIRVNSPTVSRRHAEIVFRGTPPRAYLKDLGTRNGTCVNGEKLGEERVLADQDVVRVGDVTAVYRFLAKGANEATLLDTRPRGDLTQTMAIDPDAATHASATGDVALVPLTDLLGRLTTSRATGELVVEVDGTRGRVTFEDGRVTGAKFGGLDQDASLHAISELKRGKFRFQTDKPS
jgi:pSer/pThr/pTyr-binding forkhead associated (FHA) protein